MTVKEVVNNTLLEFQMVGGGKGIRTIIKTIPKKPKANKPKAKGQVNIKVKGKS